MVPCLGSQARPPFSSLSTPGPSPAPQSPQSPLTAPPPAPRCRPRGGFSPHPCPELLGGVLAQPSLLSSGLCHQQRGNKPKAIGRLRWKLSLIRHRSPSRQSPGHPSPDSPPPVASELFVGYELSAHGHAEESFVQAGAPRRGGSTAVHATRGCTTRRKPVSNLFANSLYPSSSLRCLLFAFPFACNISWFAAFPCPSSPVGPPDSSGFGPRSPLGPPLQVAQGGRGPGPGVPHRSLPHSRRPGGRPQQRRIQYLILPAPKRGSPRASAGGPAATWGQKWGWAWGPPTPSSASVQE